MCECYCREESQSLGCSGSHLYCLTDRWQVAEDRLCLVGLGHVCVIVAIVLLLGDDRWERLS